MYKHKRRSIYAHDELLDFAAKRGKFSPVINAMSNRYQAILTKNLPSLAQEQYLEIFKAMQKFEFTEDIEIEEANLGDNLMAHGVSADIVALVGNVSFEGRVALIDLIEQSQVG